MQININNYGTFTWRHIFNYLPINLKITDVIEEIVVEKIILPEGKSSILVVRRLPSYLQVNYKLYNELLGR